MGSAKEAEHSAQKQDQSEVPPEYHTMMAPPSDDPPPYSSSAPTVSTSISATTGQAPSSEKEPYLPPTRSALLSLNPSSSSRPQAYHARTQVPLDRKLGVWFNARFCVPAGQGLELSMGRKVTIFKAMDWSIEDVKTGRKVMGCNAHANSKDSLRTFADEGGKDMFQLKRKNFTSNVRIAEGQNGAVLFSIKKDILHVTPRWTIDFTNAADRTPTKLDAKADYMRRNVDVFYDGLQIGHITRPDGPVKEAFSREHHYALHIAPEVDYSIIVALCVVFDDLRTEEGYH